MANQHWMTTAICYLQSFLKMETVRWIMFGNMMIFAVMTIVAKAWLYPTYDGIINSSSSIPEADIVLVHTQCGLSQRSPSCPRSWRKRSLS